MDTQSLRTFITLAEQKNFSRTADSLFIAQSTVTNRIADLEKEVGKPLFIRNKRMVALTEEGENFLRYAKRILELANEGIQDINSLHRYPKTLRIGATNTIYECHLFPLIAGYHEKYPQNAIKITISHSRDLLLAIQDNLFDLVYSYIPLYKTGYTCELFRTDRLLLVTSTTNTLYQTGITRKALADAPYLYCDFALQEVGLFIRELFPPHFQFGFEIDNSTKLIPYLLAFGGISFLPESLVSASITAGQLRSIPLLDFAAPKINCYKIYAKNASPCI